MSNCYKRVNFYDLCRLCAQNIQKNKIKIFENEGGKNQLQFKIKKYLCINVKEDDCLPKVVCSKCIKQLEMCMLFREECLNSEMMLSTYFKNYKHTEEFKRSGKVYIKDTSKPEVPNEALVQPCKNNSSKLEKSKSHISQKEKNVQLSELKILHSSITPSQRNVCLKAMIHPSTCQLRSLSSEDFHRQNVQLPMPFDSLNAALKKVVQQLPKDVLSKVVVNSNGEVIHLSTPEMIESALNDRCRTQKRKGKSMSQDLYNDVIKIDLTDDDNAEQISTRRYSGVSYYKNGHNPLTPENPSVIFPVPSHQNDNNFSTELSVTENYSQHHTTVDPTVINVICNDNDGSATSNCRVNNPSSNAMEDLHTSEIALSATPPVQNSPKLNHNSPKVHTCEVCSKTFKRREHLYQHMKLHTGFRPYQCTECSKSFVRKEHLLRHTVLHSGERNFSCDICSKSFSRHDNLLKHIRTHNKEPSYTCDICQKVFIIKHYYESHRAEHGKCFDAMTVSAQC
ncbi:uncharacterized protein [Euwallacea fornicatus]|uniref:uncharacterized protein isoform X1 n=2 Tax=Euwallacea fornicatus TaxID=995702 RepID=UPI00338DD591